MPLKALLDGKHVYSFKCSQDQWDDLKGHDLYMPCCKAKAIRKKSKLGTRFFAHSRKGNCTSAPETAQHLFLKSLIASTATNCGWEVTTEHAGATPSGEQWIADVFCQKKSAKVAFEIQWSNQSQDEFQRRQDKYTVSGVRTAWLYRLKGKGQYMTDDIPYCRDLPVFGLRYHPNAETKYKIPQFDVPPDEFIRGTLEGDLRWQPLPNQNITAHLIAAYDKCGHCNSLTGFVTGLELYNLERHKLGFAKFYLSRAPEVINQYVSSKTLLNHNIGDVKIRLDNNNIERCFISNGCSNCDKRLGDDYVRRIFSHRDPYEENKSIFTFELPYREACHLIEPGWFFKGKRSKEFF